MNFETPSGGRPTLNSYLLWVAKNREFDGASIWVPVPSYLIAFSDPDSYKKILEYFEKRLDLGLDFGGVNTSIRQQNEKLGHLRLSSRDQAETGFAAMRISIARHGQRS